MALGILGIVLFRMQAKREERNRRWDIEDRAQHAEDVKAMVTIKAKALAVAIDENTEVSKAAFSEANEINKKILAIGEVRVRRPGEKP